MAGKIGAETEYLKATYMPSPSISPDSIKRARTALIRFKHFTNLPDAILDDLAKAASLHTYNAGQVIYIEGEPAEAIFILEFGWVRATRMSRDGREQAMLFLRPGEIFGDVAVFTGSNYPGTVIALEAVTAWAIPAQAILEKVRQSPELAQAVIHHLGERVLYYVNLVEDLSLRSVEARLANTLLQHAEVHEGQVMVPRKSWTTLDEMSVRLGTVRDVLSRTLRALEAEGILRVEKQAIIILLPDKLAERGNS